MLSSQAINPHSSRSSTAPAQPQESNSQEQENAKPEKPEKQKNAKPETQDKEKEKEGKTNSKPSKDEAASREQNGQRAHARPAGKSAHIPNDKFRASFGRSHTFVISQPVIVDNQPRFQYASYWFEIIDPWPVGWAYTDDCYIDYIDGDYFLFDLLHPGVRVALFVVM